MKIAAARRRNNMDLQTMETAGKHLGLVAGIITSGLVIWKFIFSPIKKYRERQKAWRETITTVCKTYNEMVTRFDSLEAKFDKLAEQRENDHKADAKIRTNLYMGQVVLVSAVRELADHQGLKINGPVQLYYEQNIEALKTGLGIEDGGSKHG